MSQVAIVTAGAGCAVGPFATRGEALRRLEQARGPYTGWWEYEDGARNIAALVLEWDTAQGPVRRTISRRPGGGWAFGPMPRPWLLYGLPEVLENPGQTVHVLGHEDAVVAAGCQGLLSVTSAEGAAGVSKTDWQPLAGRQVALVPGNDPAGKWYAELVAGVLLTLQPPACVRIVRLPDLPHRGDIRAWLAALPPGSDPERVALVRARMAMLVAAVAPLAPTPRAPRAILQCYAHVTPSPVRWLWPGRVPLGRLTLLVGRPGAGKSFLTTDLAARVSTGRPWPDGTPCPRGSVLLLCAEDDPAETLRPRLDAHGAEVHCVHGLSLAGPAGTDGRAYQAGFNLADVETLEEGLRACPDCRLVIVDPLGSFLGARTDPYRENQVRALLEPVARLAEAHGAAILVVAHQRKNVGGRHADDLALGSRAFTGVARAVWHLTRDPHDPARRLLLPGKNNLAAEGQGLAFRIGGDPPALTWETEPVALTADEALAEAALAAETRGAIQEAAEWLQELLAAGPLPAKEIYRRAPEEGIRRKTLERAKEKLGVCSGKVGGGRLGSWTWRLPAGAGVESPPEPVLGGMEESPSVSSSSG
jgi:hypothetical protein